MRTRSTLVALTVAAAFISASAVGFAQTEAPKEAKYTIALQVFEGPGKVKRATEAKSLYGKALGVKNLFLVHDEKASTLYSGYYRTVMSSEDEREAERAKIDLNRLVAMEYKGEKVFSGAIYVQIPRPDPTAPAEWDLRNAKGVYSLEVASYKDSPDRKQFAVDSVKEARARGIEAYYFHGPTTSSVCLGAFPEEAMIETKPNMAARPDEEVIVVPYMPPEMKGKAEFEQADGKMAKVVEHRFEIKDPAFQKLVTDYPIHSVNGEVLRKQARGANGQMVIKDPESFIVDIRNVRQQSMLADDMSKPAAVDENAPRADVVAPRPSTPGAGKLKGIK